MELRHLRYFIAVAEERHFTRAAERLGIAQPALSQQIMQLEEELGFRLLNRHKRRTDLLEAGKVFLEEARRTLAQAEYAVQAARRAHEGKSGRLTIGLLGSFTLLPEVLKAVRRNCPNVELALRELTSAQQLAALGKGEIDLGFMRPFAADDRFLVETVTHEPIVAALPEGHQLAKQRVIALGALHNDDFIIFPRHFGPDFYDYLLRLCAQAGFHPNIVQEAVRIPTLISLVAAGLGVALVPTPKPSGEQSGVSYIALEGDPMIDLVMVWRRADPSSVLKTFVQIVRDAVMDTN